MPPILVSIRMHCSAGRTVLNTTSRDTRGSWCLLSVSLPMLRKRLLPCSIHKRAGAADGHPPRWDASGKVEWLDKKRLYINEWIVRFEKCADRKTSHFLRGK